MVPGLFSIKEHGPAVIRKRYFNTWHLGTGKARHDQGGEKSLHAFGLAGDQGNISQAGHRHPPKGQQGGGWCYRFFRIYPGGG